MHMVIAEVTESSMPVPGVYRRVLKIKKRKVDGVKNEFVEERVVEHYQMTTWEDDAAI